MSKTVMTKETRYTSSSSSSSGGSHLHGIGHGVSVGQLETAVDYRPKIESKKVLISRSSGPVSRHSRSSFYSSSSSGGGGGRLSFNPVVYSKMAGAGIADFKGSREKEKKEMQDCNDRLATYIEKVRWLEAKNKQLEAELEALRNQKQEDWKPIRAMYEGELNQARLVISELSAQKGVGESKLAGLHDQITSFREIITTYELNAKDYMNKIDKLNAQVGEFEGELNTLRLRCGSLEDEVTKQRNLVAKYKDENARIRTDLEAETSAHIEFEVLCQTKTEENEFLQEVLDKLQIIQQEPVKVKGVDMEAFFKGELRQAINGIREMYEEKTIQFSEDMERKYAVQIDQMRSGNVRDSMEVDHAKTEVKRLREVMNEKQSRIAELESLTASLRAERDSFAAQYSEIQMEIERVRTELTRQVTDAQTQIELLMTTIQELIDAKLSLELEISCYKKLLEGEENRVGLRQLVEQSIGVQSKTATRVSQMIGQSSSYSSSSSSQSSSAMAMQQSSQQASSSAMQSTMSTSTARTTMQKTSTGIVSFQTVDQGGAYIMFENTTSSLRGKTQSLRGWTVVKMNESGAVQYKIPLDFELAAGDSYTVFAKGAKESTSEPDECICDTFSFMPLPGEYQLIDNKKTCIATLTLKMQS